MYMWKISCMSYTMILTGVCILVSKCQPSQIHVHKSEIKERGKEGDREREKGGAIRYKNEGRQVNQKILRIKN